MDEQLPIKHIKLLLCNVFNFTLTDGIASEWIAAGGCYCPAKPRWLNNTLESKAAQEHFILANMWNEYLAILQVLWLG